jgi:hypothetical protein
MHFVIDYRIVMIPIAAYKPYINAMLISSVEHKKTPTILVGVFNSASIFVFLLISYN